MLEEDGHAFQDIDRTLHGTAVVAGGGKKKKVKKLNMADQER